MVIKKISKTNRDVVKRYLAGEASTADGTRAKKLIANYALRTGLATTWDEAMAGEYLLELSAAERVKFPQLF